MSNSTQSSPTQSSPTQSSRTYHLRSLSLYMIPFVFILCLSEPAWAQIALEASPLEWNVFLDNWLIIGPFSLQEERVFLTNEASPDITQSVTVAGQEYHWQKYPYGGVNFETFFDPEKDNNSVAAYAYTVVNSEIEQDAILAMGFDDSAKVWLNGETVYDQKRTGGCTLDAFLIPVHLQAGDNTLVIRIDEGGGSWEMVARLLPAGQEKPLLTAECECKKWHFIVHPPIVSVDLLDGEDKILQTYRASGFRLNDGFNRFPIYAPIPEVEPAHVRLTLDSPFYQPFQQTYAWKDLQDGKLPISLVGNRTVSGRVIDKEGNPIEEARFTIDLEIQEKRSDSEGRFQFSDMEPTWCDLTVIAEGFKTKRNAYNFSEIDSLEIQLESGGRTLKGVVQDEEGKPIEGATIRLSSRNTPPNDITDQQGRFSIPGIEENRNSVYPVIEHPDFIPKGSFGQSLDSSGITQATYTLEKGASLVGRVTSKVDGKPLAGIQIIVGDDRFGSNIAMSSATSDEEGHYCLKNIPVGPQFIHAFSDHYAPAFRNISFKKNEQNEAHFELDPGKEVTGTVKDQSGNPIADVWLVTDTWENLRMFRRETRTDGEGKFTLPHMPSTPAIIHILKQDYVSQRDASMIAGEHYDITLQSAFAYTIEIRLSDTGESPETVTVDRGYQWQGSNRIDWHRESHREWNKEIGSIKFVFDEPMQVEKNLLRFQSPGYKPGIVEIPGDATQSATISLKLEPAPAGLQGRVVSAQTGEPMKEMAVVVVNADNQLRMDHYSNLEQGRHALRRFTGVQATTDENGEFQLPYVDNLEKSMLVLLPPKEGFYLIKDISSILVEGKLLVQFPKLGTIQGRVTVGDKPVSSEELRISWRPDTDREWDYPFGYGGQIASDQEGYFEINQLPAGSYQLGRIRSFDDPGGGGRMSMYMDSKEIQLEEGQEATFNFEFPEGVPLKGRTVIMNDTPLADCIVTLMDANRQRMDAVQSDDKGEFIFEHAPQGEVTLEANLRSNQEFASLRRGEDIARGRASVVADGTASVTIVLKAKSQEIQDSLTGMLGDLVGLKAPQFEGRLFEQDETFKLLDQSGKIVILVFWSSDCEKSEEAITQIKEMAKQYQDNNRVCFMTVNVDFEEEDLKSCISEHELRFPILFSGEGIFDEIFALYGIKNLPTGVVIDAQGKFASGRISLPEVDAVVKTLLN